MSKRSKRNKKNRSTQYILRLRRLQNLTETEFVTFEDLMEEVIGGVVTVDNNPRWTKYVIGK